MPLHLQSGLVERSRIDVAPRYPDFNHRLTFAWGRIVQPGLTSNGYARPRKQRT
jgi:hypothetical protein